MYVIILYMLIILAFYFAYYKQYYIMKILFDFAAKQNKIFYYRHSSYVHAYKVLYKIELCWCHIRDLLL